MKQTFWAAVAAAVLASPAVVLAQNATADNAQGDRAAQVNQDRAAAPQDAANQPQDAADNAAQPDRARRQAPPRPEPAAEVFRDPGQRPNADQLPQQGNLPADRAPRANPVDPSAPAAAQGNAPQGDARFQDDRSQQFQDDRRFQGDANVRGGANFDAQAQSGQQDNQWRYKWHNGRWWYWTPQDNWVVWMDNQWQPYSQGMFSTGSSFDSGYASGGYSTGTTTPGYSYNPGYTYNRSYGYSYPSYRNYGSYPYNYGRSGAYFNYGSPRYYSGYRGWGGGYPGYGWGGYPGYGGYGGYGRSGAGISIGRGGVGFGIRF